jgi:hypothetical protein
MEGILYKADLKLSPVYRYKKDPVIEISLTFIPVRGNSILGKTDLFTWKLADQKARRYFWILKNPPHSIVKAGFSLPPFFFQQNQRIRRSNETVKQNHQLNLIEQSGDKMNEEKFNDLKENQSSGKSDISSESETPKDNMGAVSTLRRAGDFFSAFWKTLLMLVIIIGAIFVGLYFNVDNKVIAIVVLAFGIISNFFAGLLAMVGLLPIIGPILVKILTLPFFWVLNGLGYLISVVAIKKGYSRDVVNTRVLTIILLVGVVIGYILGNLIPFR